MPQTYTLTTSKNTIYLLGQPLYNEDGAAAEPILPGMLVRGISTLNKNNTADAVGPVAVALERREMGKGVDDLYAIGDTVYVGVFKKGARFLGIVNSGIAVNEGDFLSSAGDGTLKIGTAATALARSRETMAAGTKAVNRVTCEVV